jgi:hypothetical protein
VLPRFCPFDVPRVPQCVLARFVRRAARRRAVIRLELDKRIEDALRVTRGRIEGPYGAAKLLKINPHTLRARMRKLNIDWSAFRGPLAE